MKHTGFIYFDLKIELLYFGI